MLVVLLSVERCKTVHALTLSGMRQLDDQITFKVSKMLKTSKPGKHILPLLFKAYAADKLLYVVTCLKQYFIMTNQVRDNNDHSWLSFNKHTNQLVKTLSHDGLKL